MVNISAVIVSLWFFCIIILCAHVTVTPEVSKIALFNRGTPYGSNGKICLGGHVSPVLIFTSSANQKNDQKNPKKKKISDRINNIILLCKVLIVWTVCCPEFVSRVISRHQIIVVNKAIMIDNIVHLMLHTVPSVLCVEFVIIITIIMDTIIGQGLLETKWNCVISFSKKNFLNFFIFI